jgi:hypothetical protein
MNERMNEEMQNDLVRFIVIEREKEGDDVSLMTFWLEKRIQPFCREQTDRQKK